MILENRLQVTKFEEGEEELASRQQEAITKQVSWDEDTNGSSSSSSSIVQSSMLSPTYDEYSSELRKLNVSTKFGQIYHWTKTYCLYSSSVYVTSVTTTTSYSYTTTKTFTVFNCIPQPFSYTICSTVG